LVVLAFRTLSNVELSDESQSQVMGEDSILEAVDTPDPGSEVIASVVVNQPKPTTETAPKSHLKFNGVSEAV